MGYFTAVYFILEDLGTLSPTNSLLVSFKDALPQPSTPSHAITGILYSWLYSP
jgi:hypothetical protein